MCTHAETNRHTFAGAVATLWWLRGKKKKDSHLLLLHQSLSSSSFNNTPQARLRDATKHQTHVQVSLYISSISKWYINYLNHMVYSHSMTDGMKIRLTTKHYCQWKIFYSAFELHYPSIHMTLEWNHLHIKALHRGRMNLRRSDTTKHTNSAAMRIGRCVGWG